MLLRNGGQRALLGIIALCLACGEDTPPSSGSPAPADAALIDAAARDGGAPVGMDAQAPLPMDAGALVVDPNDPANDRRDTDCDGLSDAREYSTVFPDGARTDPADPDSDRDGIPDGVEAAPAAVLGACADAPADADPASRTSPTNPDSDGDGIPDGVEDTNRNGRVDEGESDPARADSDGDGISDALEDPNQNGRVDEGETSAAAADSDGDGLPDGIEDTNRNGQRDSGETDPKTADTDGDGVSDGAEDTNKNGVREPSELDPRSTDSDCDGVSDGDEVQRGTRPLNPDSDGDGLDDGVELGRTALPSGARCGPFVGDSDPASPPTDPRVADTDGDGISDGVEDDNGNGRQDNGESAATNGDSDGDGHSDGDERSVGANPLSGDDPSVELGSALAAVCADTALRPVTRNDGAPAFGYALALENGFSYANLTGPSADLGAAAFEHTASGLSGFVVELPSLSPGGIGEQIAALTQRLSQNGAGLQITSRQSTRERISTDGFPSAVLGTLDVVSAEMNAVELRNRLLSAATSLPVDAFAGLPTQSAVRTTRWVAGYQVLLRPSSTVMLFAAVPTSAFEAPADPSALKLADLTNGSALARRSSGLGKSCDPFVAERRAVADFIWMADISASTNPDRQAIGTAAERVFGALANNGVDFRMGVVPHSNNSFTAGRVPGELRNPGFTRNQTEFRAALDDTTGLSACEYGLEAVRNAVDRALPRTPRGQEDPRKLRDEATLAVVYISDESAQEVEASASCTGGTPACETGVRELFSSETGDAAVCEFTPSTAQQSCIDRVVAPYVQQVRAQNGIAFAQVVDPSPRTTCDRGQFFCNGAVNEPGYGYVEVVQATGGTFYSPCIGDPGLALQAIVDAVSGAASEFALEGAPISSTIKVGVTARGTSETRDVPRARQNGFDYDPISNAIFFRGTQYRPNTGDRVTVSYRVWTPPVSACPECPSGQVCIEDLGVCGCDAVSCGERCGPNGTCDGSCGCTCTPDCNGQCGAGETCNSETCQCECAADCGGCPSGTVCNPGSCQCECTDCGGACGETALSCATDSCQCECPADCGGACGNGSTCNSSTCSCVCGETCDRDCQGNSVCDPAQGCACVCPADCGGCGAGGTCNPELCQCECEAGCDEKCEGNQVCDPAQGCGCFCPENCGGACGADERCNPNTCECSSRI